VLISAERLGHAFESQMPLFSEVTFTATPGEVIAVTGPSGSGKSTLLGILSGLVEPTSGEVRRDGVDRAVWVFQNPHGVPSRTALDHVVLPALAAGEGRVRAERAGTRWLEQFHLEHLATRAFRHLSGGEAQRLMLARAAAAAPDLLLVDEPTAQLDPTSAQSVAAVLHRLSESGAIVMVATHDDRVVSACARVIRLGA
jgi:ABC-type lipoprotein export system ATPase subunit